MVHGRVMQGWKGGRDGNSVFLRGQGLWLLVCKFSVGPGRSGGGDPGHAFAWVLAGVAQ